MVATTPDHIFENAVLELRSRYELSKRQKSDLLFGVSIQMKRGLLQELRNPTEDRIRPAVA